MILEAASAALSRLFTPPFRAVLWKSLGLTALVLVGAWFLLSGLFSWFALPWLDVLSMRLPDWLAWLGTAGQVVAYIGFAMALGLLIAPVTALIAGFFQDDVAAIVEAQDYPADPPGRPVPTLRSAVLSAKFLGVVILGNLLALGLLLVPVVNLVAFFAVNGYLLGREFFEFAAMRHRGEADAKAMRRRWRGTVFAAGLLIAAFLAVPVLNLLTPLFAAGMMVHLHKLVARREAVRR
jgi:CysZ protein